MANRPNPAKVVEGLKNGETIQASMLEAGYAPSVARKGRQALTATMIAGLLAEGITLADLGRKLDREHVENAIAGTLYTNMLTGESKGNEAAKMLGTMVKYEAFKSDSNTNLIVLADLRPDQVAPEHVIDANIPQLKTADVE